MLSRHILIAVAVVGLLCGCGFYGRRGEWADVLEPTEPEPLLSDGTSRSLHDKLTIYSVGCGDGLSVEIAGHEEFSGDVGVDQRGRIVVPNTDDLLEVEGLSLDEVEGRVARAISPYVVGRPEVNVTLMSSASKFYYVLGGVLKPGVYPMGGNVIRLREALGIAGFFESYVADKSRVGIVTPDPERPTYLIANGRKIMLGVDRHNIILKPGDVVFVQNRIVYDLDRFLYALFITTENTSTTHNAVKFWEDAIDGDFGDFMAPKRGLTIVY